MFDDLAFDRRLGAFGGGFGGLARSLPPEAPLAMPPQVIEWGRRSPGHRGWLRRLLLSAL